MAGEAYSFLSSWLVKEVLRWAATSQAWYLRGDGCKKNAVKKKAAHGRLKIMPVKPKRYRGSHLDDQRLLHHESFGGRQKSCIPRRHVVDFGMASRIFHAKTLNRPPFTPSIRTSPEHAPKKTG
jgi:hypothetical protein